MNPRLAFRLLPDATIMHEPDLALDHFLAVFHVFHRFPLQIKVLGIDRLLIKDLVKLCAQVFQPVVPLGPRPVVAHGLNVDHPGYVR